MSLTDDDRELIAQARELAAALDVDALRVIAGSRPGADNNMVRAEALGVAQYLLGELASRLDPPARAIAEVYPWCKGCRRGTASAPCPRCGRPASACAECGRCPDCDGDLPDEGQSRMPAPV